MTLVEQISALRLKAVAADDETRIKARSGEFITLRERLQAATVNAASAVAGRVELQAANCVEDGYEQSRTSVLSVVQDLVSTLQNLTIDAKLDLVKLQCNSIETHFKNSEKFVVNAWQEYARSFGQNDDHDDHLLDALERGGVDVDEIRSEIEKAESTLLVLRNRTFPHMGDVAKMQQALDTLNTIRERVAQLIDPEIANLVVRAQDGGIPYSEMTPGVVEALSSLGILDRFRVVLK